MTGPVVERVSVPDDQDEDERLSLYIPSHLRRLYGSLSPSTQARSTPTRRGTMSAQSDPAWEDEEEDLFAILLRSLQQAYDARCHLELRRARREIGPDLTTYQGGLSAEDAIRMLDSGRGLDRIV